MTSTGGAGSRLRQLFPTASGEVDAEQAYAVPVGRAWMRANMVATVDGAATAADHKSANISSDADRSVFATLRRLADVVLVGAGTARSEGYRPAKLPIAVVTSRLDLDLASPLLVGAEHRTLVLTTAAAGSARIESAGRHADVVVCGEHTVDLRAAVAALHQRGLLHVLCEGGPTLLGSVVAADLLDELCLTVSPLLLGGADVPRVLAGPRLPAAVELEPAHLLESGGTLFARYLVRRR